MDGQSSQKRSAPTWLDRDGPWLACLLIFVGLLRCWLVVNTEVTARDSIGFIRYALSFDRLSWSEALLNQHQHPGYPAVVWLVSKPMRALFGTTPETMRLSAQFVSLLASLFLAFVMFRLGKVLWDRYVGFFAALMFQCFPISGHHLSDGVSDGLFLVLALAAILTLIRARETAAFWRYALGGALIGLSYLTRPEGLLVLPAVWLFLLGLQFAKSHRRPWSTVGSGLLTLTFACILAGAPYFVAVGTITRKPSAWDTLEKVAAEPAQRPGLPLFASLFAANFAPSANLQEQLLRTLRALAFELGQALNYVGGIFAVWALLFCRKTLQRNVGFYLLAIYFLIHAAILVKLGLKVSYVSDRHVMALVAVACYLCVIGITHLSLPWARWCKVSPMATEELVFPRVVQAAAACWLVLAIGICAGKTVTRLHANRVGNHQAGLWLAKTVQPGDLIVDDHNWSHFYAGSVFEEGREPILPADAAPNCYVVMTRSKDDGVREKRETQEESLKRTNAQLVYHWPAQAEPSTARIAVYALPRRFETHPWKKADGPSVYQPVSRTK